MRWSRVFLAAVIGLALTTGCSSQSGKGDAGRVSVHRLRVGAGPYDLVAAFGSIWISGTHGVGRFDPERLVGTAEARVPNHGEWTNVAAGQGRIWYLESPGYLVSVNPSTERVVHTFSLWDGSAGEAFEHVGASRQGVCASQITPNDRAGVVCLTPGGRNPIRIPGGPGPIAGAPDGTLWVGGHSLTWLTLKPSAEGSIPIPRDTGVAAIGARGDKIWVALDSSNGGSAHVWLIEGRHVVSRLSVPGAHVAAIAPANSGVWLLVASLDGGAAYIDFLEPNGELKQVARVPRDSQGLAATGRAVWTTQYQSGTATVVIRP